MLSWQLASLTMAKNLEMAVTLGGSIVCCGELVASSPPKLSNQLVKTPCSLPLAPFYHRNSCTNLSPGKDQAQRGKSMVVVSAQQAKLPVNGGSRTLHTPAFDRRQIVDGNATFGVGQEKANCLHFLERYGDWSSGQLILTCSRPNHPMETVSRDVTLKGCPNILVSLGMLHFLIRPPAEHTQSPEPAAPLYITVAVETSNSNLACVIWR
ncbi:hypothetical protein N7491_005809 [Penicillium cf. griseofulvum]|uniref:Uncharacterized protein n=1 Tax=Penicillium cf. griseofulvum TaxID=2972120 RepID=A0A9W9J2M2_9EURO|nr:hypothetical protein N7472_008492 [Penicillium cf. griseofulvum]KAJ5435214.1 hypothetical protein N7491_005809 [Penicillium cf. griseofulvum]KAJ5453046.1 hypothetical protein N7445_001229 [Penicillium cf. griseofulvum]